MHATGTSRNRHIVDQLADVRTEIKKLQEREAELKGRVSAMMGDADSLGGDQYIASQSLQERKGSIDEAKIARFLGVDNLDEYRKPGSTYVVIRVDPRVMDQVA